MPGIAGTYFHWGQTCLIYYNYVCSGSSDHGMQSLCNYAEVPIVSLDNLYSSSTLCSFNIDIVTCQAHPVLVKKGESNLRFVF